MSRYDFDPEVSGWEQYVVRIGKAQALEDAAELIRFPEGGAHTEESLYFNSYYVNRLLSRAADIREGRA